MGAMISGRIGRERQVGATFGFGFVGSALAGVAHHTVCVYGGEHRDEQEGEEWGIGVKSHLVEFARAKRLVCWMLGWFG